MRLYWGDPDSAFARWDADQAYYESKCPTCDCCGEKITSETFKVTTISGHKYRFHDDCLDTEYTDDYIEEMGG